MAQRRYKPTSAGTRQRTVSDFKEITTDRPHKKLTRGRIKRAGRNNQGRITVRYQGGGHKRAYREIDFRRNKDGVRAVVKTIEYDPFRKARIALVCYADGEYRYILAPEGLKVGMFVMSGVNDVEIREGNCLPLSLIPVGTNIHCIELKPGAGGQLVRGAGNTAALVAKETEYAQVKLPSGEVRMIHIRCRASIGQLSNMEHANTLIGKAGRNRWLGRMPGVRGVAQNPVDHPMGGGEGKSSGGRHPTTPWGKKTKGLKTRKRQKNSNKFILKRRKAVASATSTAPAA